METRKSLFYMKELDFKLKLANRYTAEELTTTIKTH